MSDVSLPACYGCWSIVWQVFPSQPPVALLEFHRQQRGIQGKDPNRSSHPAFDGALLGMLMIV